MARLSNTETGRGYTHVVKVDLLDIVEPAEIVT
jgi:hypothetical protein